MKLLPVYDAGRTRRFHTLPDYSGLPLQSVAEHSWGVAVIFCALWGEGYGTMPRAVAVLYALTHDVEESVTGDVPAPAKWHFPGLKVALDVVEDRIRGELGTPDPDLLDSRERELLKLADAAECYAYASRRAADGSASYRVVAANILQFMEGLEVYQTPGYRAVIEQLVSDLDYAKYVSERRPNRKEQK